MEKYSQTVLYMMVLETDMGVTSPWFQRPEGTDPKEFPGPEVSVLSTRKSNSVDFLVEKKELICISLKI